MSGKKAKKQRREQEKSEQEPKDPSKRDFIRHTGTAALSLVVPAFLQKDSYDPRFPFLEQESSIETLDWKLVVDNYVPLGLEKFVMPGTALLEEIKESVTPFMIEEIKRRGFDIGGNYDVNVTIQDHGVPVEERLFIPALEYCKQAIEFLYERIEGLDKVDINWTKIKRGEDYSQDFNNRAYLCQSYYEVQRIRVTNLENPSQNFLIGRSKNYNGGAAFIDLDTSTQNLNSWYVVLSTDLLLLNSIFSETIPLTVAKSTVPYAFREGHDNALIAEETFVEATAFLLGLEMVRHLNIPNGHKHIITSHKKLTSFPEYGNVDRAIGWMVKQDKDGLQKGFDMYYNEGPKKFMDVIRA